MKILFFEPYALNTPHFETCLELMQRHIDKGDEVVILGCDGNLPACAVNMKKRSIICNRCISKRKNGLKLLNGKFTYKNFEIAGEKEALLQEQLRLDFKTIKELQSYTIGGFEIGYAVGSTLISLHREPNLFLEKVYGWKKIMRASYGSFLSMKNQIELEKPDRVYLFNGRFAILKAAFAACKVKNIDCYITERGANISKFMVFKNHQPHSIKGIDNLIREYWKRDKSEAAIDTGKKFYIDRKKGKAQSWVSFTKDQKLNSLPKDWNPSKKNIVIFNSSEDEFASIGEEWKLPFYQNQTEGIKKTIKDFETEKDFHFYLRLHPNLKNVKSESLTALSNISSPNLTIIPPESDISTYSLIDHCYKVLTFGSTAGIEGTFWGKPSIMAGTSLYMHLDATYRPKNHSDLVELLNAELQPKDKENAIQYGYYQNTYGEVFKHFEPETLFTGKFNGAVVEESSIYKYTYLFYEKIRKLIS